MAGATEFAGPGSWPVPADLPRLPSPDLRQPPLCTARRQGCEPTAPGNTSSDATTPQIVASATKSPPPDRHEPPSVPATGHPPCGTIGGPHRAVSLPL